MGIPVDIDNGNLPRTLIRLKPDWHAAEVVSPRETDYYESSRALGHLYRAINLDDLKPQTEAKNGEQPPMQKSSSSDKKLSDPISVALKSRILRYIKSYPPDGDSVSIRKIFQRYADELRYICSVHTLSNTPGATLQEAEVVTGTILAKCSQRRWRKDRIYRMRLNASLLVREVRHEYLEKKEDMPPETLARGLAMAWQGWAFSLCKDGDPGKDFGKDSFGLIALGVIFECLEKLEV